MVEVHAERGEAAPGEHRYRAGHVSAPASGFSA